MTTLAQLEEKFDVRVFDYIARDADVPTVSKAACQGDVSLLRITAGAATRPIPAAGVAVVRGEVNSNTHSLHGEGFFDLAINGAGTQIGTLTVPDDSEVFLLHPEHGGLQINPGTYRIGRQREQADEIRAVAD